MSELRGPTEFDARAYWRRRHDTSDPLPAGGDSGLSSDENYEFYAVRLGQLFGLVHKYHLGRRPLRILDAGCGNGVFAGPMAMAGHRVVGIDFSDTAVTRGRAQWPQVDFAVASIEDYESSELFHVVYSIDVLFHVLDDDVWRMAVHTLARYCRATGTVIVTDTFDEHRYALGDYIVHRSRREYLDAFSEHGFELVDETPYAFGSNPNRFAVFRRKGV